MANVETEKQKCYMDYSKQVTHIRPVFQYERQFDLGNDKVHYQSEFKNSFQKANESAKRDMIVDVFSI